MLCFFCFDFVKKPPFFFFFCSVDEAVDAVDAVLATDDRADLLIAYDIASACRTDENAR